MKIVIKRSCGGGGGGGGGVGVGVGVGWGWGWGGWVGDLFREVAFLTEINGAYLFKASFQSSFSRNSIFCSDAFLVVTFYFSRIMNIPFFNILCFKGSFISF